MNLAGLVFLLFAHFFAGRGLLKLFKVQLPQMPFFCLSMMTGVALLSFAPCLVQLLHLPIAGIPVFIAIVVLTAAVNIPSLLNFKRPQLQKLILPKIYEWPFLIACLLLVIYSVWRCFYYPPYSRDMLTGPELLAEYAVREHTMISSVFSVDLTTSNNYFKSPYITGLQIIYKLFVCPFGQLWLSVLFISFTVWLYNLLITLLHPMLACLLLLIFLAAPELFAYTFLILYDYSNMVFFFLGFYFLARYLEDFHLRSLSFSAFLFGLATYIRTETLILVVMIVPLVLFYLYRNNFQLKIIALRIALFLGVPIAFWFLCIHIFVRLFVPIPFELGQSLSTDLGNISYFFDRLQGMNTILIFSGHGMGLFGYEIFLFCGVFIANLVWPRSFTRDSVIALYGVIVVYFGLAFIGYLLPLADLQNTTKRGLFKILPLMLWYTAGSGILQRFSAVISKWEHGGSKTRAVNNK